MEHLMSLDVWISFATLSALEIVLGIDNIIFIAILVGKLPREKQEFTRRIGLGLALITRIGLLFSISWLMSLTKPIAEILGQTFSGRDFILLLGGLFLIGKATWEIHDKLEGEEHQHDNPSIQAATQPTKGPDWRKIKYLQVLSQIIVLDIVFSLDSVITAIGMAQSLPVMVAAMIAAVIVMLVFAKTVGDFVMEHPTIKILALSFLLLIGVTLFMDGMGTHVNKGYIYFAMAFSLVVEILNMRYARKHKPLALRYGMKKKL